VQFLSRHSSHTSLRVAVRLLSVLAKMNYICDKAALFGERLELLINTSGRDQDPLNYSFIGLPLGAKVMS
jgi:hypothetical protein